MSVGEIFETVNDILPLLGKFIYRELQNIHADVLVSVIMGDDGDSPDELAAKAGQMNAYLYSAYGIISHYIKINQWKINVLPNFVDDRSSQAAELTVSLSPMAVLIAALKLVFGGGYKIIKNKIS